MQWDGGATLTLAVEIFLGKPPKMSTNLQAPIFNTFFFNTSHQHWDGGKPAAVKPKFANFFWCSINITTLDMVAAGVRMSLTLTTLRITLGTQSTCETKKSGFFVVFFCCFFLKGANTLN